jgi:hypothetical protein
MKSITGNAVNLSFTDVRLHPHVPSADMLVYSHLVKKREGVGRAIGNVGSVCGILMALLVNPCACGLMCVCVFTRARAREHTLYSFCFGGPCWERVMANV